MNDKIQTATTEALSDAQETRENIAAVLGAKAVMVFDFVTNMSNMSANADGILTMLIHNVMPDCKQDAIAAYKSFRDALHATDTVLLNSFIEALGGDKQPDLNEAIIKDVIGIACDSVSRVRKHIIGTIEQERKS